MKRLFSLSLAVLASSALAAEVYVNGVNVEGLANTSFEKVNVKLDAKGNVQIDAPGYNVKRVTVGATTEPAPEEAIMTKKYFLVTEQSPPGMTEFDIDLAINGKAIRTMKSSDEQIVTEVSKHLKPGRNTVLFHARKVLANKEQPKSTSKTHIFRVIIGEGAMTDEQVIIEKQVIVFTRNASESNDVSQELTLTTR